MEWIEFNRELQNRVSDPGVRYCLGIVYERLLDIAKQQDQVGNICLSMAKTMDGFVQLNEVLESQLRDLRKTISGERSGIELRSVPLTND